VHAIKLVLNHSAPADSHSKPNVKPHHPTTRQEFANEQNKDSLVTAIKQGDTSQVNRMLRDGVVQVDTILPNEVHMLSDREGLSPLMIACMCGQYDTAKLLLEYGATVDLHDSVGWSALMHTIGKGYLDIVELLLSHGADVDLQSAKKWESPRSLALSSADSAIVTAIDEAVSCIECVLNVYLM
jgi:ankyrin repeat protein